MPVFLKIVWIFENYNQYQILKIKLEINHKNLIYLKILIFLAFWMKELKYKKKKNRFLKNNNIQNIIYLNIQMLKVI